MPNSTGGTSNGTRPGTRPAQQTVHNKKELKEEIYRKNYKSAPARVISEKDKKNGLKLINKLTAQSERNKEKGLA